MHRRQRNKPKVRRPRAGPSDVSSKFERLLRKAERIWHYSLRLYITGTTRRSAEAVASIRALCEEHLKGRYDLEVIDIYQQPRQAMSEQIIAAPTLVKRTPLPPKRLVGNLCDRNKVLLGLNLRSIPATKTKWAEV